MGPRKAPPLFGGHMDKRPAESYIKRNIEVVPIVVRIPETLKEESERMAAQLDTSMNRFVEAALRWYIVELTEGKKTAIENT